MRVRFKQMVMEAQQIRMSTLGPYADGGTCATNPFNACMMRRPRWWKRKVPMMRTARGWIAALPDDWFVKMPDGFVINVTPAGFAQEFEEIDHAP